MSETPISESHALQQLITESVASRLWQRDASLWPEPSPGGDPASETLGWLNLPLQLSGLSNQFSDIHTQVVKDGFTDVVVLGMGGSSMTPLAVSSVFDLTKQQDEGSINLHALDTINPESVEKLADNLNLDKTLFFVSSKSGTTIEPLTLEKFFRSRMSPMNDLPADRRNWVALTDPGTPLSERARAGEFGTWVSTPEDVGGRFSALSAFGMMPLAVSGLNTGKFAESAVRMAQRCQADTVDNPGLELAAFLAANALKGRDKVTLLTPAEYAAFGMWVDQLLAESTGKDGKGLIPITGEPLIDAANYGNDRQIVIFDPDGNGNWSKVADELSEHGHPVFMIQAEDSSPYQLAGEFFRWQFATAAAASLLGIYPFDQPDVESAKAKARQLLSAPADETSGVELEAALETVSASSSPSYVALVAYLHEDDELTQAFTELRRHVVESTGLSTTFGYGPRYLHSTGQLYKGGPKNAIVLGFVSGKYDHLAVPGEAYTFGELVRAQANADFSVMGESGQQVFVTVVGDDPASEIRDAVRNISQ